MTCCVVTEGTAVLLFALVVIVWGLVALQLGYLLLYGRPGR
jgi:hypothetical protein